MDFSIDWKWHENSRDSLLPWTSNQKGTPWYHIIYILLIFAWITTDSIQTYYELPTPDISYEVMEQIAIRNKKKRQALSSILCLSPVSLVYQFIGWYFKRKNYYEYFLVHNESAEVKYGYFAAAIHRIYDFKHRRDVRNLVFVFVGVFETC